MRRTFDSYAKFGDNNTIKSNDKGKERMYPRRSLLTDVEDEDLIPVNLKSTEATEYPVFSQRMMLNSNNDDENNGFASRPRDSSLFGDTGYNSQSSNTSDEWSESGYDNTRPKQKPREFDEYDDVDEKRAFKVLFVTEKVSTADKVNSLQILYSKYLSEWSLLDETTDALNIVDFTAALLSYNINTVDNLKSSIDEILLDDEVIYTNTERDHIAVVFGDDVYRSLLLVINRDNPANSLRSSLVIKPIPSEKMSSRATQMYPSQKSESKYKTTSEDDFSTVDKQSVLSNDIVININEMMVLLRNIGVEFDEKLLRDVLEFYRH